MGLKYARLARKCRDFFVSRPKDASNPDDFAGVHDVVGVERLFEGAHDAHGLAMLGDEEVHLAIADAMLAGAGAVHGDGALHHAVVEPARLGDLLGLPRIENESEVEVAVADMPHQHGK